MQLRYLVLAMVCIQFFTTDYTAGCEFGPTKLLRKPFWPYFLFPTINFCSSTYFRQNVVHFIIQGGRPVRQQKLSGIIKKCSFKYFNLYLIQTFLPFCLCWEGWANFWSDHTDILGNITYIRGNRTELLPDKPPEQTNSVPVLQKCSSEPGPLTSSY